MTHASWFGMTKSETRREIIETVRNGDQASALEGDALWANVERLMFWRASPNELRGLDDTGLTSRTICEIALFTLPSRSYSMVSAYLSACDEHGYKREAS
jgi:hypothetical protein